MTTCVRRWTRHRVGTNLGTPRIWLNLKKWGESPQPTRTKGIKWSHPPGSNRRPTDYEWILGGTGGHMARRSPSCFFSHTLPNHSRSPHAGHTRRHTRFWRRRQSQVAWVSAGLSFGDRVRLRLLKCLHLRNPEIFVH